MSNEASQPQLQLADAGAATIAGDDDYPEVMREIAGLVQRCLVDAGIEPQRAQAIGENAAESVREHYGGTLMYLPKGHTMKTRRRWRAIWDDFTGANHEALARKHGLNVKAVYKVLAIMREYNRKRTQLDMFEAARPEVEQQAQPLDAEAAK